MATLGEIVTAVQAALAGVDVASIPPTPPENIGEPQLPALIVYPASGAFRIDTAYGADGRAQKAGQHTLNVDLHVTRTNLPVNVAAVLPLCEDIADALLGAALGNDFGGTVTLLGFGPGDQTPLRYQLAEMNWGGRKTIGWRFEVDVTADSDIA